MAMYASVTWTRVANSVQQPQWAVYQLVYDENNKIVFDENGQPVVGPVRVSPPGQAQPVGPDQSPPIPVVMP